MQNKQITNYLKANLHAHTFRCQHAYGTEREYVETAIEMGIKEFGFSDHIFCPFKTSFFYNISIIFYIIIRLFSQ